FFQQLVFADVGPNVMLDLSGGQKKTIAYAIDTDVVADGGEIFRALAGERANQVLWHATQAEATDHDGRAVENIADRFVGVGYDFVHWNVISYASVIIRAADLIS